MITKIETWNSTESFVLQTQQILLPIPIFTDLRILRQIIEIYVEMREDEIHGVEIVCVFVFVQSRLRHPSSCDETNTQVGLLLFFARILLKHRDGIVSGTCDRDGPSATQHLH